VRAVLCCHQRWCGTCGGHGSKQGFQVSEEVQEKYTADTTSGLFGESVVLMMASMCFSARSSFSYQVVTLCSFGWLIPAEMVTRPTCKCFFFIKLQKLEACWVTTSACMVKDTMASKLASCKAEFQC
jgi:hypothetical protein